MKTTIVFMLWMLILSIQASAQPGKKNGPPLNHNPKAVGYVTSFTLVDPVTDTDIRTLTSTDFIHAFTPINIRVNTEGKVKSMLIEISNAETHLDNDLPYTIAGDMNGDYITWIPEPGSYTITATPYNNKDAHGKKGTPVTIQLTVLPAVESSLTLTLVNTETNQDIMVLSDMTELDMSQFSGIPFNIRADVEWNLTESVTLDLSGLSGFNRTDNDAPYTLISETEDGWHPAEGGYTITATAFSQDNAAGQAGPTKTITFTVKPGDGEPQYAYHDYIEFNNLLVIYTNTNGGKLPGYYADSVEKALEEMTRFYWRHSHMNLNLKWTVYVIDEYLERVHEFGYVYPHEVDADLRSRNLPLDTYDAVSALVVGSGAYAWGTNRILGKGAYFQVPWWEEHYLLSAFFMHEFHHVLDAMFVNSGHSLYPHNHPGAARATGEYVPHSGPTWDLNAQILQHWDKNDWYDLVHKGNWGTLLKTVDNEQDGFPDNEPNVPLDEARFGSSNATADTDSDGLTDLQEAMTGIFLTSNPVSADSDGDGIADGTDSEPIYPINTTVPFTQDFTLMEDITDWPVAGRYFFQRSVSGDASFHLAYSTDRLFIGAKLPTSWLEVRIIIDANNDGIFYGSDNIEIVYNTTSQVSINQLDAAAVPANNNADYIVKPVPFGRISSTIRHEAGWSSFQFALDNMEEYGLYLQPGEQIGVSVQVVGYGFMLEHDDLLTVSLGEQETLAASNYEDLKTLSRDRSILYPNPAKREINITLDTKDVAGTWRIVDSRGVEMKRSNITAARSETININIESLATGLYLLYIESAAGKKSYKFIKQ